MKALLIALTVACLAAGVAAKPNRSTKPIAAFKLLNPCPATGKTSGSCPGYVVDHIEPLCAQGADEHWNMQWQTIAAARAKDVEEARLCRVLRRVALS